MNELQIEMVMKQKGSGGSFTWGISEMEAIGGVVEAVLLLGGDLLEILKAMKLVSS